MTELPPISLKTTNNTFVDEGSGGSGRLNRIKANQPEFEHE